MNFYSYLEYDIRQYVVHQNFSLSLKLGQGKEGNEREGEEREGNKTIFAQNRAL